MKSNSLKILIILLVFIPTYLGAQTKSNRLRTTVFAGTYKYGKNFQKTSIGLVTIYPESDTTVLFFIDLNRGAPSYNMGQLYGRLTVNKFKGIYYSKEDSLGITCKFECVFKGDKLLISVVDNQDDCGFGFGVYPDGTYKRVTDKVPLYFVDATGTKVYFKNTKPEDWNK